MGISRRGVKRRTKFELTVEPETMPVEGNASAIDEKTDRETVKSINDELDRGNVWAWCMVKMTARYGNFEGVNYLGGCSYIDEKDFKRGGYYESMKEEAFNDLMRAINDARQQIEAVRP